MTTLFDAATSLDARLSHEASLHATGCNEGTTLCGADCDAAAATHEVSEPKCGFCNPDLVEVEECIGGCGEPVETRNGKAVGCLHSEDCHSIEEGCL